MKLIFSYDVENKSLDVIDSDGNMYGDLHHVSISKYGDKYDCSIMKSSIASNGMNKTETWSCYAQAELKKTLEDFIRNK